MNTILIGNTGESAVIKEYKKRGYKILTKNYKIRLGEIDIIAMKNNLVVFIEVKTRKNSDFMLAREAVTKQKQSKIKITASSYLKNNSLSDNFVRFDVAEVYTNSGLLIKNFEINIIEQAFE